MKPHHKPLHAHRRISILCVVLLFAAFVLLLLVGISSTIIKGIYILEVFSLPNGQPETSIATKLRFGVWGLCALSALDQPTFFAGNGVCFGPKLGYEIPEYISALVKLPTGVVGAVLTSILVFLILHLVAAGFSFVALFSSLFLASHSLAILSLVLSIISAIISTVVFALDLALVLGTKSQLPGIAAGVTDIGFAVAFGNGVWMVLVGMLCAWAAVIALSARVCHCCGVRRKRRFE